MRNAANLLRLSLSKFTVPRVLIALSVLLAVSSPSVCRATVSDNYLGIDPTAYSFVSLLLLPDAELSESRHHIEKTWQPSYTAMALDVLSLSRRASVRSWLFELLGEKTGQKLDNDTHAWFNWIWNQPEQRYQHYAEFKSHLYRLIDPKFAGYFNDLRDTDIRLDEVRWGGVVQDGIPPLRSPQMLRAGEADYLQDDNVVFGIAINGDARAYPKRILAWHEMFIDEVGGVQFAGVYCTLCGAVILYETNYKGTNYAVGTSGFLYRSNKLMYDLTTQSLWSTTRGEPVIGPLVGKGIQLQRSYVVTTTWGEWRRRHPDTSVLSLDTGHKRDYGEGVAYRNYFSTDALMFDVPKLDNRLNNKDEILALTFPVISDQKLAIHAEFLAKNPLYHDQVGPLSLVVLTDKSGANRVYETNGVQFAAFDQDRHVTDSYGDQWIMTEDALTANNGRRLKRLPAHRAFWFGWYAAHNDTRLVY